MHHTVPAAFFQLHLLREFSVQVLNWIHTWQLWRPFEWTHCHVPEPRDYLNFAASLWEHRYTVVLKAWTHSATPLRQAVEFKVELMLVIVLWLLASTSIFAQRTASRWIFSLLYKPLRWLCKKNPSRSAVTQTLRPQLCHVSKSLKSPFSPIPWLGCDDHVYVPKCPEYLPCDWLSHFIEWSEFI